MSWHFFGEKPVSLLERVRPNEDEEIKQYRIDNYEPITKSAADKAIKITSKILNPNLYSIRWEKTDEQAEQLKKYTLEDYPDNNSLPNFMKDVTLRKMLADPNGIMVATFKEVPETQTETLKPILKIFGSKNIYDYDDEHFLIFISKESRKKIGNVYTFDYYDKDEYIEFEVYAKNETLYFTEIERYQYFFDQIPVWFLGGMSEAMDDGTVILKSFYSSAAPYWNLAITHESDVFASYIRHMFPQKYEVVEACAYRHDIEGMLYPCRGGFIKVPDGQMKCPNCEGSGYQPIGPLGTYQYTKDKLSDANGSVTRDPVGYITVPTDATKMLEERSNRMIEMGSWAINMDIEDKIGENQSGVAKVIDRSAQHDTLYDIGTVIFDVHITNAYYFFNKYMFGVANSSAGNEPSKVDNNLPQVNKPTQFDIGSVAELINNFKAAKESGLDPNFLQMKQVEIQTRDLSTNPDLKKFTTLLLELDPLPGMATVDVNTNVSRGFVSKEDAVIHFNLKAFTERAIAENKTFLTIDKTAQLEILNTYAKEFVKRNKPVVDTTMIPNYGA